MNTSTALITVLFGYCVTGSNAWFGNIKFPKFPKFTIGIPKTFPRLPPATAPPPSTIPTTPPPTTTHPTTLHPDDITIALCTESMRDCPWTSSELVAKIVERQHVDTEAEFNGEGTPVGPTVNPDKVKDHLIPQVGATSSPGSTITGTGTQVTSNGVPTLCLPFGKKSRNPASYIIDCISYRMDTTIPQYANRIKAMLGCFKCRYLCELGGELKYL